MPNPTRPHVQLGWRQKVLCTSLPKGSDTGLCLIRHGAVPHSNTGPCLTWHGAVLTPEVVPSDSTGARGRAPSNTGPCPTDDQPINTTFYIHFGRLGTIGNFKDQVKTITNQCLSPNLTPHKSKYQIVEEEKKKRSSREGVLSIICNIWWTLSNYLMYLVSKLLVSFFFVVKLNMS